MTFQPRLIQVGSARDVQVAFADHGHQLLTNRSGTSPVYLGPEGLDITGNNVGVLDPLTRMEFDGSEDVWARVAATAAAAVVSNMPGAADPDTAGVAFAGVPYLDSSPVAVGAGGVSYTADLTGWPSTELLVTINGLSGLTVAVAYFPDTTLTSGLGLVNPQVTFPVALNAGLHVLLPNLGAAARLTLTSPAGTSVAAYWAPSQIQVARPSCPQAQTSVSDNNVSLPAASSVSRVLPWNIKGRGRLHFNPADATGKLNVTVRALNLDDTQAAEIYTNAGPVASVEADFVTDWASCGIFIRNTDGAAAHSYSMYADVEA